MNLTIERIIAFVTQAMAEDMRVQCNGNVIEVYNLKTDEWCNIKLVTTNIIKVTTKMGSFSLNVSDADVHKFQVLCDSVDSYSQEKGIDSFLNFFKEENKSIDINDLDNDEE